MQAYFHSELPFILVLFLFKTALKLIIICDIGCGIDELSNDI